MGGDILRTLAMRAMRRNGDNIPSYTQCRADRRRRPEVSKVTRYLDCGCALLEDGSRSWCPTCANGGPKVSDRNPGYHPDCFLCRKEAGKSPAGVAETHLCRSHVQSEWLREKAEAARLRARIEELEGCLRELWEAAAKLEQEVSGRFGSDEDMIPQTREPILAVRVSCARTDALLTPPLTPDGPDGPVADTVDGYRIRPGEEE